MSTQIASYEMRKAIGEFAQKALQNQGFTLKDHLILAEKIEAYDKCVRDHKTREVSAKEFIKWLDKSVPEDSASSSRRFNDRLIHMLEEKLKELETE